MSESDTSRATSPVSDIFSHPGSPDSESSEEYNGLGDADSETSSDQLVMPLYNVKDLIIAFGTEGTEADSLNVSASLWHMTIVFTDFVPQLRTRPCTEEMEFQVWKSYTYSETAHSMIQVTKTKPLHANVSKVFAVGTDKILMPDSIEDWDDVPLPLLSQSADNCEQKWVSPVGRAPIVSVEHRLKSHLSEDEEETLLPLLNGDESDERNTKDDSDFIKFKYCPDEDGASLLWELEQLPPQGTKTSAIGTALIFYMWEEPGADHQTSTHAETLAEDLGKLLV